MADRPASIMDELGFRYDPSDLYQQVIHSVLSAAESIDVPRHLQLIMAEPKNEVIVHFPVEMDDGSFKLFKGYRVQHNNILGPYKGGMRFHPDVSLDHVKSLAVLMTMKTALLKLPYGGAKGGVQADSRSLSTGELRRLTRRFTSALGSNIGPGFDIPAPDVGTNAQIMAWMADTYINLNTVRDRSEGLAVVTGKPLGFGGSLGREKATGQGVVYILEELLPEFGLKFDGMSFGLIGYGNVGSWAGRLLGQRDAIMKTVMDHTGAIHNDGGIDTVKLAHHVQDTGGVAGFDGAEAIDEKTFYETPVDVFIPAALEQMIDESKAELIQAKVIAEAANAPTTPLAHTRLMQRGVEILPAILCNAGGVAVSYMEWRQNRLAETWDEERIDVELRDLMSDAARRTKMAGRTHRCDLRSAAYIEAMTQVAEVYKYRGIFP